MPNYVTNGLSIKADAETLKRIREEVKSEESAFDFDKIIPMPDYIFKGDLGPKEREQYETLYEKEAYYDEGGARFCLIAEGAGNSLPCEINNDIDEFNFQFIQRLYDVVQTYTGAYLADPHSLEQVAAEISDSEIEQMIKYAEWDFDGCDKVSRESIVYWYALLLLDSTPSSDEDPIAIFRDELYQFLDNISFNTKNVYKG